MENKLPILIIIPHGGYTVPEELAEHIHVDKFDILFSSDTCANELFSFDSDVLAKVDTHISRLFVDVDRPHTMIPPRYADGVIKKETFNGKVLFNDDVFPDELATKNILKRYHTPFHQTIDKILRTGEIKLIIECHTMMPVGSRGTPDSGKPRPIFTVGNYFKENNVIKKTCDDRIAAAFLNGMKRSFADERITVAERFSLNKPPFNGYILGKYGAGKIPMLRFLLSRALFFNEEHFNYDYLKVDELRINQLRGKILTGIQRFYSKFSEKIE
jgi:N-formylglutamate amidohydrolase